ncbi:hypothetical protein V5O48_018033 [Marasmius crinis-equi]|uniref:C2H2-type domain-containing protein n=1 Tax=Marasmius crinis-equi TaxID=585013 RepID=A0ABR3EMA2_9AGAR
MGKGSATTRKLTSRGIKGPSHMLSGGWEHQQVARALQRHAHKEILKEKRDIQTKVPTELNAANDSTHDALMSENNRMAQMAMLDEGGVEGLAGGMDDCDDEWVDEEKEREHPQENEVVDLFHTTHEFLRKLEYRDHRTRRDKIELDQAHWEPQLDGMVQAFMDWEFRYEGALPSEWGSYLVETPKFVDFDGIRATPFQIYSNDEYKSASYVRNGAFPCTALIQNLVISTKLIRLYHCLFMRCPRLAIQPFIKGLCDRFGFRFNNHYAIQFSSAYDLYLEVKRRIRHRVALALGRASPNWRMLNSCPCCQYPVEGQLTLLIRMILCMDGNDSLKRVERRSSGCNEEGSRTLGQSRERPDPRIGGEDYMLSHEAVDEWDIKKWRKEDGSSKEADEENASPCEEKWKNMNDSHTAKSWAVFDIQGWFILLCRHGFLLKAADMVRSGEQVKYPLAVLHAFLEACEEEARAMGDKAPQGLLGVGYDLGCKIRMTITESPLRALAEAQHLMMLVGILHGHAHRRLCQLAYLLLYVLGAGMENCEGCERYFSKSNALASVTRHASRFHRRQAITEYARHHDNLEVYANLSKHLHGNYKAALKIRETELVVVDEMKKAGIDVETTFRWLKEEEEYLRSRAKHEEPLREALEKRYYKVLREIGECKEKLESSRSVFQAWQPDQQNDSDLRKLERTLRNQQELELKLMRDIQDLEAHLGIERENRWLVGSAEWVRVGLIIAEEDYRRALETLEALVVARIFELAKLNLAGTGYRMRQHLAKSMQARSKAIDNALKEYNAKAQALNPPKPTLDYKEVMEYTFLSDFDLLSDTRTDVRQQPWAEPKNRLLVTKVFQLLQSEEEIERLNNEIQSLYTYMKEEAEFLQYMELELKERDPILAHQIRLHGWERARSNDLHYQRLKKIRSLPGFHEGWNRFFRPGIGIKGLKRGGDGEGVREEARDEPMDGSTPEDDGDSEGEEDEDEAFDRTMAALNVAAGDSENAL